MRGWVRGVREPVTVNAWGPRAPAPPSRLEHEPRCLHARHHLSLAQRGRDAIGFGEELGDRDTLRCALEIVRREREQMDARAIAQVRYDGRDQWRVGRIVLVPALTEACDRPPLRRVVPEELCETEVRRAAEFRRTSARKR